MSFKVKLADNKKKLHKSLTVILSLVLIALSVLDLYRDEILQHLQILLPMEQFSIVSAVLGLLIIFGRYIKQASIWTDNKDDNKDE